MKKREKKRHTPLTLRERIDIKSFRFNGIDIAPRVFKKVF